MTVLTETLHRQLRQHTPSYRYFPETRQHDIVDTIIAALRESMQYQDATPLFRVSQAIAAPHTDGNGYATLLFADAIPEFCSLIRSSLIQTLKPLIGEDPATGMEVLEQFDHILSHLGRLGYAAIRAGYDERDHQIAELTRERDRLHQQLAEQADNFYRTIVEQQTEAIVRHRPDGRITFANRAYCRAVNQPYEKLVGQNLFGLVSKQDRDQARQHLAALTRETPTSTTVYRTPGDTGEERWYRWTSHARFDSQGTMVEIQSVGHDITDQIWAEEAYHVLVEHSIQGLIILQDQRFVFLNPAMANILGLEVQELQGLHMDHIAPLIHPEDRTMVLEHIKGRLRGEPVPTHYEFRALHKSGDVRHVEISVMTIPYRGKPAIQGTCLDITERKRTEAALQVSDQQFRSLVEQSPDGITLTDEQGIIIEWNRGSQHIFGMPQDTVLGCPVWDVQFRIFPKAMQTPEVYEQHKASIQQALQTGQAPWANTLSEHEFIIPDGTRRYIQQVSFPIQTPGGYKLGSIVRDITARKQVEEELEHARLAAEAAVSTKAAFLANMSHEIRTPLNAIIGMTNLLLKTSLSAKQYDFVETAYTSSNALLTIINDILDFSKIEAGKLEFEQQPFQIRQCIEDTLDLLATKAADKNLDLAYLMDDTVPTVILGDVNRIRQILINLIGNAIKFTDTGEVVVSVEGFPLDASPYHTESPAPTVPMPDVPATSSITQTLTPASLEALEQAMLDDEPDNTSYQLHLTVRDTGMGIAPTFIERLFQSFTQEDVSTTRKYGGTGLGLAISKRLAEMMGGTIWVESEVGKGSSFHVTLTTNRIPDDIELDDTWLLDAEDDAVLEERLPPYMRQNQPLLAGKRVLIVDDSTTSRYIITNRTRLWGMSPKVAVSDLEALKWLRQGETFDVAILDIHLPEMDSLTLAAALRSNDETLKMPLLVFISAGLSIKAAQGSGIEHALFQTKPIKPALLYDSLIAIFSGKELVQTTPPPALEHITLPTPQTAPGKLPPLTILLAEDTPGNQKVALYFLEHLGYRADLANNGQEVLQSIEQHSYDVIFMDVQMPELDGYETTRHIRSNMPPDRQPWIIAMTAHAIQGDREKCLDAGMDDYMSKPILEEELEKVLRRVDKHRPDRGDEPEKTDETPSQPPVPDEATPALPVRPTDSCLDPDLSERFLKTIRRGGAEVMHEIISVFIKDMSERVAAMEKAVEEEKAGDLKTAAHSLKSLSAQVGATTLSEYSHQLEMCGIEGTLEGTPELVARASAEYQRVQGCLERIIREEAGGQ